MRHPPRVGTLGGIIEWFYSNICNGAVAGVDVAETYYVVDTSSYWKSHELRRRAGAMPWISALTRLAYNTIILGGECRASLHTHTRARARLHIWWTCTMYTYTRFALTLMGLVGWSGVRPVRLRGCAGISLQHKLRFRLVGTSISGTTTTTTTTTTTMTTTSNRCFGPE